MCVCGRGVHMYVMILLSKLLVNTFSAEHKHVCVCDCVGTCKSVIFLSKIFVNTFLLP